MPTLGWPIQHEYITIKSTNQLKVSFEPTNKSDSQKFGLRVTFFRVVICVALVPWVHLDRLRSYSPAHSGTNLTTIRLENSIPIHCGLRLRSPGGKAIWTILDSGRGFEKLGVRFSKGIEERLPECGWQMRLIQLLLCAGRSSGIGVLLGVRFNLDHAHTRVEGVQICRPCCIAI